MNKRLSVVGRIVCALCLILAPLAVHAQYDDTQAGWGYHVSWQLDPLANTTYFPGANGSDDDGNSFGTSRVLSGMDFDDDGNLEMLFAVDPTIAPGGNDPGYVGVFLMEATGDDTYDFVWHYRPENVSNSLPGLEYGDIDGDGRYEIYLGVAPYSDFNHGTYIFEQGEDGTFPSAPTLVWDHGVPGTNFRPSDYEIADVDGDGKLELVTTDRGERRLSVDSLAAADLDEFATFGVEFSVASEDTVLDGGGIYVTQVVDFDGDGAMEIWVNTWDYLSMAIYEATAANMYALQADINGAASAGDPGAFNSDGLLFTDLDGDGAVEGLFPMTDGKLWHVGEVADVSTLTTASFTKVLTFGGRSRGAAWGDVNRNGNMDIVAGTGRNETVELIEYSGSGSPADSASYTLTTIFDTSGEPTDRWYRCHMTDDLDGDWYPEIILTNQYASDPSQRLIVVLEYGKSASVKDEVATLPSGFELRANFPNPFNPVTTIEYVLPQTKKVSLKVYNVNNQLVKTLASNELKSAGTHRLQWNSTDNAGVKVASGVYIYTLEWDNRSISRQMTLVK